jgi:hypothetical protein
LLTDNQSRMPISDRLDAVLEASCEALVALEVISASVGAHEPLKTQIGRAMVALRRAIVEVRVARSERPSVLASGFVIDSDSQPS